MSTPASLGSRVIANGEKILSTPIVGKAVSPDEVTRVLYHGSNCPDGFAAAFVAHLRLGDRAQYFPQDHPRTGPLPVVDGEKVCVVDYCFKKDETAALLASTGGAFIVLDHHASAEKELVDVPDKHKVFAMGQSGATLSWNFFFPDEQVPLWLRYVEDKDIWRWALKDSEAFTAGFSMVPQTFEAYGALHTGGDAAVDALIEKGAAIVEYRHTVVSSHVRRAVPANLRVAPPGLLGAVVNCTTLASEVGNAVCKELKVDYAAVWSYDGAKKEYYVSLRSIDGERADVSIMAKQFGGGGHRCAAGFSWKGGSIEELFNPASADSGVKRARE
jgi:hypothetical protein